MTYPILTITDATTDLDVLDAVERHLLQQNRRAVKHFNGEIGMRGLRCSYRTVNGLACAVGALLTDEEAKLLDDGQRVSPLNTPVRLHSFIELLTSLQSIHDNGGPRWPEQLKQLRSALTQRAETQ